MKTTHILTALLISAISFAQTSNDSQDESVNALLGEWLIDLRPSPDTEPYYQVFAVEQVNDSMLTGSFYGSTLQDGLINKVWPELYFAFTTNDASHSYYHSGYMEGGKLKGTTYCPGRAFIARWTGKRKK